MTEKSVTSATGGWWQQKLQAHISFWQRYCLLLLPILVLLFVGALALVIYAGYQGERFWWLPWAFITAVVSVIILCFAAAALLYCRSQQA